VSAESIEKIDVAVVGGGLAALAAAYDLRDQNVVVLEAADRCGGRLLSEPAGDYWLNMGAHMFGGSESLAGALVDAMGLETRPIGGRLIGLSYKGRALLRQPPEIYPLMLPLPLHARLSLVRAGLKLRMGTQRLSSLESRLSSSDAVVMAEGILRFEDRRTLAALIGPLDPEVMGMVRAFTERSGADPEEMSAGHGLRSFANVWSDAAPGRNLVGGSSLLPSALAASLGNRVRLGHEVIEVRNENGRVRVRYKANGGTGEILCRSAVVATPAFVTRSIIPELPARTRVALSKIRYGAFLTAAVLTRESRGMPWDGVYAISTPARRFSAVFNMATTLRSGARRPGGSLMLFRGARGAEEMMGHSDDTIARMFADDLVAELPDAKGIVQDIVVQRWTAGAPFAAPGRAELQPALSAPLGNVFLAGDYLHFPNMEAAIASGHEAARSARRALHETASVPGEA
jgi:oxygen-dependent protoporphyrinogen oxidase